MTDPVTVTAEWVRLKIKRYSDGVLEAYEEMSDTHIESKSWEDIKRWVSDMLDGCQHEEENPGEMEVYDYPDWTPENCTAQEVTTQK